MFPLDPDLGSQANHDIAKGWLTDCRKNHQNCPDTAVPPALPSRVLDVGSISSPTCRLVQTEGVPGHYAALSHCWGGPISPLLDKNTLEPFQREIPLTSLPANFYDAIVITRQLAIQYLWIDSLCIVQDSAEDWESESAVMGDIYRRSLVTISALDSAHSRAGILSPRKPLEDDSSEDGNSQDTSTLPSTRPTMSWLPISDTDPTRTVQVQEPTHIKQLSLVFKLKQAPLLGRGWTLQESILPPRQLYYTSQQIFWRCLQPTTTSSASQNPLNVLASFQSADGSRSPASCLPTGTDGYPALSAALHTALSPPSGTATTDPPQATTITNPALTSPTLTKSNPHTTHTTQTAALLSDFRTLIQDFTSRSLTVITDMLPAMSGIAQALDSSTYAGTGVSANSPSPNLGDYLAGVWSTDIPLGLLWVGHGRPTPDSTGIGTGRRELARQRGAPSWSWAASGCAVRFLKADVHLDDGGSSPPPSLQLVSHHVTPRQGSRNMYGPVAEGSWIRLRGVAAPAFARENLKVPGSNKERIEVGFISLDENPRHRDKELFVTAGGEFKWKGGKGSGTVEYLLVFATVSSLIVVEEDGRMGNEVVYRRVGLAQLYEKRVAECGRHLKMLEVVVV